MSLVKTVTGPAHLVTNQWETDRNVLLQKSNALAAGSSPISSYLYSVNDLGQRDDVTTSGSAFATSNAGLTAWKYNDRGEVVSADHPQSGSDRSYDYDAIGNRLAASESLTLPPSANYTANALNQYSATPEASTPIVYDADGNLEDSGTGNLYKWDAENRLIDVQSAPGASTFFHWKYRYDYLSRRVFKQKLNQTGGIIGTQYAYYDGWNIIHEASPSQSYGTDLLWGPDLSGSMQGAGGVGGLLLRNQTFDFSSTTSTFKQYYPTYDGNGNVSEYLLSDGSVAVHWEYDPFGNITEASGPESGGTWKNIGQLDGVHRFSSKPLDRATGLYYYGYRYYDPVTGRWPSRDPIGEEGGINLYGMVKNLPVGAVDLFGLMSLKELEAKKLAEAQELSDQAFKKDNKGLEYCGAICCKDGEYAATGPFPGRWRKDGVPVCNSTQEGGCGALGDGWVLVSRYHTHPSRRYNILSNGDKELADRTGVPISFTFPGVEHWEKYFPDKDYDKNKEWNNGFEDKNGKPNPDGKRPANGGQGHGEAGNLPKVPAPE